MLPFTTVEIMFLRMVKVWMKRNWIRNSDARVELKIHGMKDKLRNYRRLLEYMIRMDPKNSQLKFTITDQNVLGDRGRDGYHNR